MRFIKSSISPIAVAMSVNQTPPTQINQQVMQVVQVVPLNVYYHINIVEIAHALLVIVSWMGIFYQLYELFNIIFVYPKKEHKIDGNELLNNIHELDIFDLINAIDFKFFVTTITLSILFSLYTILINRYMIGTQKKSMVNPHTFFLSFIYCKKFYLKKNYSYKNK